MKVPETYRLRNHPQLGSDSSYGNNGFFLVPHPQIALYYFQCMVSDGAKWDHVSISLIKDISKKISRIRSIISDFESVKRCPTWEEMCFVKSIFFDDEESVMQLHPPKSQWINNYPYCLHLWRPQYREIPLPDKILVGFDSLNTNENKTV